MTYSDLTLGLIELVEEVSHDPAEADWFDVHEYLELVPSSAKILKELTHYLHENYL